MTEILYQSVSAAMQRDPKCLRRLRLEVQLCQISSWSHLKGESLKTLWITMKRSLRQEQPRWVAMYNHFMW